MCERYSTAEGKGWGFSSGTYNTSGHIDKYYGAGVRAVLETKETDSKKIVTLDHMIDIKNHIEDSIDDITYDINKNIDDHVSDTTIHVTSLDKSSWNGKESALSLQTISSGNTLTAEFNKYYAITASLNTFTITLPSVAGVTNATGFMVAFTAGSTPNLTISGSNLMYNEGYSIEANKTYELNFLWNGVKWFIAYGTFE